MSSNVFARLIPPVQGFMADWDLVWRLCDILSNCMVAQFRLIARVWVGRSIHLSLADRDAPNDIAEEPRGPNG